MNEPFDRLLRQTLNDYRVSRGEKRVLSRTIEAMGTDARTLAVLRSRVFDIARAELMGPEARGVLDWLEDVNKLLVQRDDNAQDADEGSHVYFSSRDDVPTRIKRLIDGAARQLDICVFTITDDRISDAVHDASRRGVAVRIVTDNDKSEDLGSDVQRLERLGIPVRVDHTEYHMHHKFALFDNRLLLNGSYNWTRSAARKNQENVVVTRDPQLVGTFRREFERLWDELESP